jgi:hypothetical protein
MSELEGLFVGFFLMLLLAVLAHGLASLGDVIGLWDCRGCGD